MISPSERIQVALHIAVVPPHLGFCCGMPMSSGESYVDLDCYDRGDLDGVNRNSSLARYVYHWCPACVEWLPLLEISEIGL